MPTVAGKRFAQPPPPPAPRPVATAIVTTPVQEEEVKSVETAAVPPPRRVALWAWLRYLHTDHTSLSSLYQNVIYERMHFPVLLLAFKLVLVLPAILVEPRSLNQLGLVLMVEAVYGLFTVAASPYLSPWINCLNRIGVVHQLLLVGLQGFYAYEVERNRGREDTVALIMVFLTAAYLSLVACFMGAVKLLPFVRKRREASAVIRILEKGGFASAAALPLYVAGTTASRQPPSS